MEQIDSDIEVNEECIPNHNITYDIFWNGKQNFEARLHDPKNDRRMVSFEDAPKVLKYVMVKPLEDFTTEEKTNILAYKGLTLEDGFEASDVFMESSFTKLIGINMVNVW